MADITRHHAERQWAQDLLFSDLWFRSEGREIMPQAWTDKQERQYEHIKDSERSRGRTPERAKEIAARTVNKQRRQQGETPNKTTQGTGNPHSGLEGRSKEELYNRAKQMNISGRSRMSKSQLVAAIRKRQ